MHLLIERFCQILGLGILVLLVASCGGGGGGFSGGQKQNTTPATPATPLSITTSSLQSGTVGQAYLQLLEVQGGSSTTVVQWVSQGQLPPGLKLDSSLGTISGTPTTAGTYPFLVQAQDTQDNSLNSTIKEFSITIAAASDSGAAKVKDVQLLASSPQLASAGDTSVTLTAVVRDINNNTLKNVTVIFKADNNGTIQVIRSTTDDSGTAEAKLSTLNDKNNRKITVTADANGAQNSIIVNVIGTTIKISGPSSAAIGDQVSFALQLVDSRGNPIPNQTLSVSSAKLNAIISPSPITNTNGQAQVIITANNAGTDLITVTGAGASQTQALNVSTDALKFLSPSPGLTTPEINLNTNYPVTVRWQQAGIPVNGQAINFGTTRGIITPTVVTTNVNGEASTVLSADTAGRAVITAAAQGGSPSTQVEVLFVATQPNDLTLQADPSILNPGQQSTIKATVFDPKGNRVKGKTVNFTLSDTTGGSIAYASAVTDEYGEAFVTYTAGPVSSANNGVQITASVQGTALQKAVGLSVSQQLFVTLGTGNLIQKPNDPTGISTRYKQPYNVLVTTGTGAPVANVAVTLSIVPTFYRKGDYQWSDAASQWIPTYTSPSCPNEDFHFGTNDGRSGNGILDPGEDQNGNNKLDPGNVVTLENPQGGTGTSVTITTSSTAGSEGFGFFNVVYAQQFANWIEVALTARATVAGSEAMNVADYILPILAADVSTKTVSPPGNPSPFGTSTTCTNTQ